MRISDWSSDVCSSDLLSGMTAAYEFSRRAGPGRTCLLLENHPIVGGEAKQNEFLVEGRRLTAPQGSNGALLLKDGYVKGSYGGELYDVYTDYYRELGIPTQDRKSTRLNSSH